MKKLCFLCILSAAVLAKAEISVVSLPEVARWQKASSAVTVKNGKALILRNGSLLLPGKFAAGHKDCITITILYKGKGKLQLSLHELDKKNTAVYRQTKDTQGLRSRVPVSCCRKLP